MTCEGPLVPSFKGSKPPAFQGYAVQCLRLRLGVPRLRRSMPSASPRRSKALRAVQKFKGFAVQCLRRSMALRAVQKFNVFIVNCSLLIAHCKFSFAAFSVVARHSSSKLGSTLTPKKIVNCKLLIAYPLVSQSLSL